TVERLDAVPEPCQPRPTGRIGTTETIIADLDAEPFTLARYRDVRFGCVAVLGDVGESFDHHKVGGPLDLFWLARRQVDIHADWNGRSTCDGRDRGVEPAIGQDRRVDAAHEVAKLLEHDLRFLVRLHEELPYRFDVVRLHAITGTPEIHRHRHESLLRAVVKVALDATALKVHRLHHGRAALGQLLHSLGEDLLVRWRKQPLRELAVQDGQEIDQDTQRNNQDRADEERKHGFGEAVDVPAQN